MASARHVARTRGEAITRLSRAAERIKQLTGVDPGDLKGGARPNEDLLQQQSKQLQGIAQFMEAVAEHLEMQPREDLTQVVSGDRYPQMFPEITQLPTLPDFPATLSETVINPPEFPEVPPDLPESSEAGPGDEDDKTTIEPEENLPEDPEPSVKKPRRKKSDG